MATTMPRVRALDIAGLKAVNWVPRSNNQTVGEMVDELVAELKLPEDDGVSPIVYSARRESDGMALSASEKAFDVLSENETMIVLEPDVNAG